MKLLACSFLVVSLSCIVHAKLSPTYPEPGTVWRSGLEYKIAWLDDKTGPEWSKFKIDFMTGDNHNQKFLKNVAANLDATSNVSSLHWVAPQVEPNAAIYFFMFTNEKGEHAWTTRFGITGLDGKLSPPQHDTQPDGKKIPWGVGKLLKSGNSTSHTTSAVYSMTPAQSSVAAENAALIIAVSSANKIYSGLFMLMACVIFSIVLFTH